MSPEEIYIQTYTEEMYKEQSEQLKYYSIRTKDMNYYNVLQKQEENIGRKMNV